MEEDKRFAHIATDPKFRRIPKGQRKVKIDKRFKSMFSSKQFKVKYTVDKRGRPINHTSSEDLKRYYELSSDGEDAEEGKDVGKYVRAPKVDDNDGELEKNSDELPSSDSEDETQNDLQIKGEKETLSEKVKTKLRNLSVDYARGESKLLSESSSDEESEESDNEVDDVVEHAWGELDHDADRTEEATRRLAVCNMDWDRIKAVDLMLLLSSFLPPGGLILSVKIYPSEFGLQRMKEEEIKGPTELTETKQEESDTEEGSKFHMEKLRQYQLNRLKYYYAVVTCDSKNSANKIYTECDGLEYESSATRMDLRFIPDEMDFEQEVKDTCEKLPEPGKYQPRFFTTTALQQAKVNLTWDETNPDRVEVAQKLATGKVDDVSEGDIQAYLASSSDEEDNEESSPIDSAPADDKKTSIDKYKSLLEDINNLENAKKEKDVEMEITWGIDLKDKTEKLVKQKLLSKEEQTPFQKYLQKRKEKRKQKKEMRKTSESESSIPSDVDMNDPYFAEEFKNLKSNKVSKQLDPEDEPQNNGELELLVLNQQDDRKHFSLRKIQEKEQSSKTKIVDEDEEDFKINVQDPRFSALYSSHHFNLDPTDPHYKKTDGMEAIKSEKLKRRNHEDTEFVRQSENGLKKNAELNVLIKSVKRKTEALGNNKKKKKY